MNAEHEVIVRCTVPFESAAAMAGFVERAVHDALADDGYEPMVAVVWKDPGEPWRMFVDGEGVSENVKPLVFSGPEDHRTFDPEVS